MALTPGTRIGSYQIAEQIGVGGMGEVYRATDTSLGRAVAIKVLPDAVAGDAERLARFDREARTLAALNHPNIATIHGLERSGGTTALVMELVEGPTLADRIAHGALPVAEALPIAKQIAEALEAAHEQGIIHRDLKPANVKVRADGTVKILDFGLAKAMEPATAPGASAQAQTISPAITTPAMTQAGMILGTAAYMSPEQASGAAVDQRSDIWAFGVVLYEMLSGRQLFDEATVSHVLAAVLKTEPDWTALPGDVPSRLQRLLRRCLEKDRRRRLHAIADARIELEDVASGEAATTVPPVARQAASRRERLIWMSAVALVTLLAVAATSAWLTERASRVLPPLTRLDLATPSTDNPFSFAISPEGRRVVFAADGEAGRAMLWLRPLDRTTAEPLAGTEGATYPFWAPDGRAIGFFAGGQLKRIDLAGGAPRVLADAPDGRGGTWNDDDVIVFTPSPAATALMRVSAEGGTPEPFTGLKPDEGSHRWPQFLPDGRRVLFLKTLGLPQTHGVFVASLDGGEATRVMAGETAALFAPPGHLLHVSQGVLFAQAFDPVSATVSGEPIPVAEAVGTDDGTFRSAVSVSSAGVLAYRAGLAGTRRQLVWVDRMGAEQGAIGEPDEMTLSSPALSSDGRRAAVYRVVRGNLDVWLMDLSRGVPSRFTFDVAVDAFPIWSPDATQVAFLTGRNGNQLFVKAADGASDEQPLLTTERQSMPLDWSPDGVLLYSTTGPTLTSDLWALPVTGGGEPFAVVETGFDDIQGELSPDGRWLAYASNESGRYEVYVQAFPESGGKWQVSSAGGLQPRWRRDGQELYFVAPDARLMAAPIGVAADGRSMDVGVPIALFPTRLATGAGIPQTGMISRAQYSVARDGRFLMNVAVDEEVPTPPITIVQNWTAALEP